jgi:hypothetical protein
VSHPKRQRRRQAKSSNNSCSLLGNGLPRVLEIGQDPLTARLELQAGFGRADATGRPREKAYTQLLLQPRNPAADDGLRNA